MLEEQIHRGLNVSTSNESKEENEEQANVAQEGADEGEVLNEVEEKLFRAISNLGKRPKFDLGMFSGNLNPNKLIDWINELEDYFEYEDIKDLDRVRYAKTKMKGHAKILWQEVHLERNRRGKEKITKWDHMVNKLKKQFIPVDYELDLLPQWVTT